MWPNPQETADLVTFTKEILNGQLHFLCTHLIESWDQFWQMSSFQDTQLLVFSFNLLAIFTSHYSSEDLSIGTLWWTNLGRGHWHNWKTVNSNDRFCPVEVPWTSNPRNRFIGSHKIFFFLIYLIFR